jgi:hypothetical protein
MIKGIAFSVLFLTVLIVDAQNLQLHYDLGKNRKYLTSTVEMFKPDKHGNTYFFIDMDYNSVEDKKGVTMAYWEISRALKFWKAPVAFHTEYNGGFGQWKNNSGEGAFQIENAFLNGVEYSCDSKDFSRGFTLQVLHKYIQGKHNFSFQLTGVWYLNLAGDKLSFTGFADFWREDLYFENNTTKFCFSAEPQCWYNFNTHFALGSEVETDINFGGQKGFHLYPTIGAKYTF